MDRILGGLHGLLASGPDPYINVEKVNTLLYNPLVSEHSSVYLPDRLGRVNLSLTRINHWCYKLSTEHLIPTCCGLSCNLELQ